MADAKISDLAATTSLADTDEIEVASSGTSKKITGANLRADLVGSIPDVATATHAASSKTPPVDADEIPLADSAASFALKKLTWANLKAAIKAYTDTLYPSGSGTSTGTNTGDQTLPTDATIVTTDVTTNDVSTSKHGWAPKAPNDSTKFLRGDATWAVPSATVSVTYDARTSNTILGTADRGKAIVATTAGFTQTFTAAATLGAGWWCYIKNGAATGLLTLDPNSTETIDGAATKVLLPGQMILVECDGSNFTSQVLADPYEWTTVRKGSDEDVSSSTTLQDDDELFFTTASGANYEIELNILYISAVGGGTPDLKWAVGEDGTARGAMTGEVIGVSDNAVFANVLTSQTAAVQGFGTSTTLRSALIFGTHVGAGGTFKFQWAQVNSGSNATTVKEGSVLRYRRIA